MCHEAYVIVPANKNYGVNSKAIKIIYKDSEQISCN